MLELFPQLIPDSTAMDSYLGFIEINNIEYFFNIVWPTSGNEASNKRKRSTSSDISEFDPVLLFKKDGIEVHCSAELRKIMHPYLSIILQRIEQSSNINVFMTEFKVLIEKIGKTRDFISKIPHSERFYTSILLAIEEIGWDTLIYIHPSFKYIKFKLRDKGNREHMVTINLNENYPIESPDYIIALPKHPITNNPHITIPSIINLCKNELDVYQDIWDIFDDIDNNVWVIEPTYKSRDILYRRISIGSHCSLLITIQLECPRAIPKCEFLGSDSIIQPLRLKMSNNADKWDYNKMVRENLEIIMDMKFPSAVSMQNEDSVNNLECGICYLLHDSRGKFAENSCDNSKCNRIYHTSCLSEWLRALPHTRQSFQTIFGKCPYCSSPITINLSV